MPDPWLSLKAMGAAAIVSTMLLLAMMRVLRAANTMGLTWACVLAIGTGLAAGYYVLSLQLAWPPRNGLERLLTVVIPAALAIELIAGFHFVPNWAAWLLRVGLAAMLPRILLHGSVYISGTDREWNPEQFGMLVLICSGLLVGLWGLLSWLAQRSPGVSIPLALHLSSVCAGLTVMMAGYIKGGTAAFPLAAVLLTMAIASKLASKRKGVPGVIGLPAMIGIGAVGLFGLLFIGRFFGELSTESALTMLLAPLLCWTTELPGLSRQNRWLKGLLQLALVMIPLVFVLVIAKRDFDRDMAPLLVQVCATL